MNVSWHKVYSPVKLKLEKTCKYDNKPPLMKSLLIPLINRLYAHWMFTDCFSFKDLFKSDNDSHNQTKTGKW